MVFSNWIFIIAIAIVLVGFLVSMVTLKKNRTAVGKATGKITPGTIPAEGIRIPILRTYFGLKRLAPVTFIENKFSPSLVLFNDHFEYRVLRRRSTGYDRIEAVFSYTSKYYNKLRINFTHSGAFFMVVFANQKALEEVLDFLKKKGIYAQPGN